MKNSIKLLTATASLTLVQIAALVIPFSSANAGNQTYTYTACYFQKGHDISSRTWKWGLKSNNGWYTMNGEWVKTTHTKVTTFEAAPNRNQIMQSCANSRRYYGLNGYRTISVYAADKSAGSNYQIYTNNGTQLVSK